MCGREGYGTYTWCISLERMLSFMLFRLLMTHAGFTLVSGMVSARTLPPRWRGRSQASPMASKISSEVLERAMSLA